MVTNTPDPVLIFAPRETGSIRYAAECSEYCRARGYHVLGVTGSPRAVAKALMEGRAIRVVVARPEHVWAATATEVITEPPRQVPRQRRPRRLPRQAGAAP